MADEEEHDELEETEETTRPHGESDEPKVERKGSGPDPVSRSSSAAAHAQWAGRSASAAVDSRYPPQQQPQQRGAPPQQHRPEAGGGPQERRYEYERPPPPGRYDSGLGIREEGRHAGGMVGDRYGEAEREHRGPAKMEYPSPSMRMPPPGGADPNMPPYRNRPSSPPPPRLPGFASLEPEGLGLRPRDDLPGPYSSSPRRPVPFHGPSYASYPPPPARTPLMHHHASQPSPTPSTSYGNPPMIHPALAGLPGAGGGPGGKQQPSFVSKLYSMLEDPSIGDLISWGTSGSVFSVANPAEFSRLVLPNWFKHSNWQSFVRQLNMYGFHKVNHSYQGNPTDEVQVWEFRHPSFRRGEIAALNDIKRKSSRQKRGSPGPGGEMRADRSAGSSTPSPEVSLSSIAGGRREFYDDQYARGGGERYEPYPPQRGPPEEFAYARDPPPAPFVDPRSRPDMDRAEAIARFEDLSERTDAIIRHASFLESQIRIMAVQMNESRATAGQMVREEMVQMLDRLERALTAPGPPGVDSTTKMVEAIRGQLAFYSHRAGPKPIQQIGAEPKRPSI
uniref:HSF-type DNA-binding domain-containing protein n=2 Tax=Kalmanozyma brasiliensis (strain GHG001) TaxID=1365824 RepID=V5ET93_KALBG